MEARNTIPTHRGILPVNVKPIKAVIDDILDKICSKLLSISSSAHGVSKDGVVGGLSGKDPAAKGYNTLRCLDLLELLKLELGVYVFLVDLELCGDHTKGEVDVGERRINLGGVHV